MGNKKLLWQGDKIIEKIENVFATIGVVGFIVTLVYVYSLL